MLVACICYASFTVGLTKNMPVSSFLLLTIFSFFVVITLAIGTIFEYLGGIWCCPVHSGIFAIFTGGVMASLVGQLLFVRGVRSIGSNRAGLYLNMVPVFGAITVMFWENICRGFILFQLYLCFQASIWLKDINLTNTCS